MEKTEWRLSEEPHGWMAYLGSPIPIVIWLLVKAGADRTVPTASYWPPLILSAASIVVSWFATHRVRVRVTPEGVEVRHYRTRVYPWAEISSVEVAPEWETKAVWLRTQSMHPQAAADVLPVPRAAGRKRNDTTVDDAVRTIQGRLPAKPSATP